jgi:eukaryotic-like serine/threonine-protein kinase
MMLAQPDGESMNRRSEDERPVSPASERSSASKLLAETPSSVPPSSRSGGARPESARPEEGFEDEQARSESAAAEALALASKSALEPTVADWLPARIGGDPGPDSIATSRIVPRPDDAGPGDALAGVGLRENALVDRTYRVERVLGSGGMGVVALARDERLDRKVAIKFIKPELFAFPEMRSFFHNEARAMARVSHPNVLQVYAFGEHEGTPYFVMEYVEGKTADHWLKMRLRAFPEIDEAIKILDQACRGVEAIHATDTVHRDLKPSNLLIDQSFRVSVGDLGVARMLADGAGSNFVVGSALYMAPEAAFGEDEAAELASRRDIYALGCIAYELLTGRPPFLGETDMNVLSQHVLQEPAPPSQVRSDLPSGYDEIIAKAMSKDPNKRYPTVEAFRRALLAEHSGNREPERILIADDDPDWRTIIHSQLTTRFPNAVIDQVADGEAALSAFERNPYSVVLVDLQMPEMDGAKLTLLLRSIDSSQKTPIIVLTAAGGPREWQRLSAIGADAFLVKPVNADDVEMLIRRTLRSRHAVPPSAR